MTLMPRLIPVLQIIGSSAVKTTQFQHPRYIGSALNTLRIFSDLQADELIVIDLSDVDTRASKEHRQFLETLACQAEMPVTYGGRIENVKTSLNAVRLGFEKVIVGRAYYSRAGIAEDIASFLGRQAVVRAIDVLEKHNGYEVLTGTGRLKLSLCEEDLGLTSGDEAHGELLVTSVAREGMRCGIDEALVRAFAQRSSTPLVVNGGVSSIEEAIQAVRLGASGVAIGDLSINLEHRNAVLVHLPCSTDLTRYRTPGLSSDLRP